MALNYQTHHIRFGRLLVVFLLIVVSPSTLGVSKTTAQPSHLDRALQYLRDVYNPVISLVSETPIREEQGSKSYWINDNILAYAALTERGTNADKALAGRIFNRLVELGRQLNLPHYQDGFPRLGLHEAVLGYNLTQPLPCFRSHMVPINGYNVSFVIFNGTRTKVCYVQDYNGYADIILYESLSAFNAHNMTEAKSRFNATTRFWDGTGLADSPYTNPGDTQYRRYATYKLALLLYVAQKLNLNSTLPFLNQMVETIWQMQTYNGGIVTNYALHNAPIGIANTETTALVVLANPTLSTEVTSTVTVGPLTPAELPYMQLITGLMIVLIGLNILILFSRKRYSRSFNVLSDNRAFDRTAAS